MTRDMALSMAFSNYGSGTFYIGTFFKRVNYLLWHIL